MALAFAAASGASPLCPEVRFAAGAGVGSVTVVDLDGDAVPDLVVTNGPSDQVSVLRGNGDGSFQPPVAFAANYTPWGIVAADLDGDSHPDLVTTNVSGDAPNPSQVVDQVSVLLGNGDGTLQSPVAYAVGALPFSLATGDFDGDSIDDLVTADSYGFRLSVMLGRGDGSFVAALPLPLSSFPTSVVVSDLDLDGVPDLVAGSTDFAVSVLLGNGDGSFRAPTPAPVTHAPTVVALADLDGDTVPDLVTASNAASYGEPNSIEVALGNGDGTFQFPPARFDVGDFTQAVAVGDLDGDGVPDLVSANGFSQDLSVLVGHGDGGFDAATSLPVGGFPNSIAIADLDGDGMRDVTSANGSEIVVLLNRCGPVAPLIDIRPGDDPNRILPGGPGVIPVALLGSDHFDVLDVDPTTLVFGPDGATRAHASGPHFTDDAGGSLDLNGDGFADLLAHFRTRETGIASGHAEACLGGALLDGRLFEACDPIVTPPACGIGFEVVLLLSPLVWLKRRLQA